MTFEKLLFHIKWLLLRNQSFLSAYKRSLRLSKACGFIHIFVLINQHFQSGRCARFKTIFDVIIPPTKILATHVNAPIIAF